MCQNINNLASLIGVQSVAVIGVSLVLLHTAWEGFERTYLPLSLQERKATLISSSIPFAVILFIFTVATLSGIYDPSLVQPVVVLVIMLILGIAIISYTIIIILRKLRKKKESVKPDDICQIYFFSLLCLALSILCTVGALLGNTSTMLNISIGQYEREYFELGRWLLWDGLFFFAVGIIELGFAYVSDKIKQWKV